MTARWQPGSVGVTKSSGTGWGRGAERQAPAARRLPSERDRQGARALKDRLDAVGLGPDHSKTLHVAAHSMGGLVLRWFIEREGGDKVVQHLVTLGTPHAGSPWPTIQVGPRPRSRSGYGDVASADGLRFVVPVRTIHSGPNPRYYGQERGVTFYNLVSDQFTGLNGITVPGTLRDSLTLLSVVLEQQTELQPTEIMSDTGAYTDTIFGIFHLLGYQFSPRLADIGGARFWRVDGKADYGALDALAAQAHQRRLIAQHWEDLLRLAGSLKLGTVQAAGLIRTLQTKDRPTKLARALEELGRLIKTLYLLRFIDDEAIGGASWCSSTAAKAATSSRASCSTASAANCGSATAKARRTSSARSAWL